MSKETEIRNEKQGINKLCGRLGGLERAINELEKIYNEMSESVIKTRQAMKNCVQKIKILQERQESVKSQLKAKKEAFGKKYNGKNNKS